MVSLLLCVSSINARSLCFSKGPDTMQFLHRDKVDPGVLNHTEPLVFGVPEYQDPSVIPTGFTTYGSARAECLHLVLLAAKASSTHRLPAAMNTSASGSTSPRTIKLCKFLHLVSGPELHSVRFLIIQSLSPKKHRSEERRAQIAPRKTDGFLRLCRLVM